MREIQRLYFRFKDSVFAGLRTYDTTILENFIKKEFTDTLTMADIEEPKLMITSVLADKQPIRLCLFRNYKLPCSDAVNRQEGFLEPADHLLWKVARCTSAAPSYFTSVDNKYVDGGLVAVSICIFLAACFILGKNDFLMYFRIIPLWIY